MSKDLGPELIHGDMETDLSYNPSQRPKLSNVQFGRTVQPGKGEPDKYLSKYDDKRLWAEHDTSLSNLQSWAHHDLIDNTMVKMGNRGQKNALKEGSHGNEWDHTATVALGHAESLHSLSHELQRRGFSPNTPDLLHKPTLTNFVQFSKRAPAPYRQQGSWGSEGYDD